METQMLLKALLTFSCLALATAATAAPATKWQIGASIVTYW